MGTLRPRPWLALLVLGCWGLAVGGEACRAKAPSDLPALGASAAGFVVPGWRMEQELSGDLNRDGRIDAVLELIEDRPQTEAERQRLLLVLLRGPDGRLRRIGLGERLLRCAGCFGMLAGPDGGNGEISIRRGVLVVEELWGSRETGSSTLRFRFDPLSERMRLIGEDLAFGDRGSGASISESTNLLTGIRNRSGKVYDEKREKLVALGSRREVVPSAKRYLDDLDCEEAERRIEAMSASP